MTGRKWQPMMLRAVLLGCVAAASTAAGGLQIGDIAPDFSLPEFGTGDSANLYDYEGHVVLMDFFTYS